MLSGIDGCGGVYPPCLVYGRVYNSEGIPVGSEFQVNTYGDSGSPAVTGLSDGGFVVVWMGGGVYGQMYSSTGSPVGNEFQVNTDTLLDGPPAVAGLNDGGFVVVWIGGEPAPSTESNIYGRIYNSIGVPVGGEFQINTDARIYSAPAVTSLIDGDFVVVWTGGEEEPVWIYGRMYNSAGTPVGSAFQIAGAFLFNMYPSIASLSNGGFIVVWEEENTEQTEASIYGQMYNSIGIPVGGEFQINTDAFFDSSPSVTGLAIGGVVVVWGGESASTFAETYGRMYYDGGYLPPPSTVSVCNMPEQCYNSSSGIVIPINTNFCQVSSQVCASPDSIFNPSTEKVVPLSSVVCNSTQICAASDVAICIPAQICASPDTIFNPSTTGTYNLATQAPYNKSTEGVYSLSGQIVCDSTQVCASSNSDSSNHWPTASIITTAVLGVGCAVGWSLYLYGRCKTPSSSSPDLKESNIDSAFSRDALSQKLMNNVVATTALQAFIPVLIMNLQMQVTNAVQTIEGQASWLTSLFEEKETHLEGILGIEGFSYLDQEMYFENQDFEFLSANDTCSSYDYCNFC